jgi:hypothetical protein
VKACVSAPTAIEGMLSNVTVVPAAVIIVGSKVTVKDPTTGSREQRLQNHLQ